MNSTLICPICTSSQVLTYESHSKKGIKNLGNCYQCSHQWDLRFRCPEDAIKAQIVSETTAAFPQKMPSKFSFIHKVRQRILKLKPESGKLLDIGSNNGFFLKYMEEDYQCYGLELSQKLVDISRSFTKTEIYQTDIMNASLPTNHFDVVTCFAVIEHIYNISEFLDKVYSLLKPNGIFIVSTGDISSVIAKNFNSEWPLLTASDHVHFFTGKSLKTSLQLHHFHILSLEWRLWTFPDQNSLFHKIAKQTIKFIDVFNLGIQYLPINDVMFIYAQKRN